MVFRIVSPVIIPAVLNAQQIDATTLADGSVTTNKIANANVTNAKLANSSVTINSNSLSLGGTLTLDTDDIGEGSTNLYYLDSRVATWFSTVGLGLLSTDVVSEGSTNLYFTDARAVSAIESEATLDLTGTLTVTGNTSNKITTIGDFDVLGLYAATGIEIEADATSWSGINLVEYEGGASKPVPNFPNPFLNAEVWGGTPAAPAAVSSGKRLFAFSGAGAVDNSGTIEQPASAPARIILETTETQTTTGRGTQILVQTTPNGSTTRSTTAQFKGDAATFIDLFATGDVVFSNLPTSDPVVAGQLWNDSGTLKISAG